LALVAATLPATRANAAPRPACAAASMSEVDAVGMARTCGKRVEVTGRRAERSLTYANPDGTLTLSMSPTPQRVRRGATWVDIDRTLIAQGGSVVPRAVTEPLVLSGGGDGPLLTFGAAGKAFSLTWPAGALPAPRLDGATATYPEVLPGVDLSVEAGVDSYRQLLIVKDRTAARNPALRRLTLGVRGDGLSMRARPDGRVDAVGADGTVVYASPGAFMWDSPVPVPAAEPGRKKANERGTGKVAERAADRETERDLQSGEPTPHRTERMPVDATASGLAVVPVQEMLTAPDTVYPVMIDPAFSKPAPMWYTNVMDDEPNHSYYGEYSELRVGRQWETSHVWRAHMQFDTTELKASTITSAELSVTADHTADCGTTSIQLWQTQYVSSPGSYTWYNDSDGDWVSRLDTKTFSANESSCPKGDDANVFSGSLKTKLQASAKANQTRFAVGLRASSESDQYEWTRFIGNKTFLTVTYNRKPNVPTNMAVTDCYLNCTSNPVVARKDPELSAFATDPDANTVLTVYFEVQTSAGVAVVTGTKTGYASGPAKPAQPAKWRITPKLGDGNYRWRARSKDEQNIYSDYSGWFGFSTDSTAPAVPTVKPANAALYFEDDDSGSCSGGIGAVGSFDLTAETAVLQFAWSLDSGAFSAPIAATGTSPKTARISVRPQKDMVRTLRVRAYDGAGRYGEARYEFRVCSPEPEAGHWKLDGNGYDDADLIPVTHDGSDSGARWVQSRHAAEPDRPEFTTTSGARAFVPGADTVVALTGDDEVGQVELPFAFPFYGGSYGSAWLDTNGRLTFKPATESVFWNEGLPSPDDSDLALYPFWDDLIVDEQASVRTAVTGTAPNRTFVVEWRNVTAYDDETARLSFQAQLGEDGTVVFAYQDVTAGHETETGGWAVVGVENGAGTRAAVYANREHKIASGTGVTFTPTGYVGPYYPDGYYEARFDGTGSINTSVPVVATGLHPETAQRRSFAVAAWIRVTDLSANRTAVSQQGVSKSMFELGYQIGEHNYCFSMFATDTTTAVGTRACATAPVVAGEWVHLAGVYDAETGTMTLYVHRKDENGFVDPAKTEVRTASFTSVWDTTGAFTIGRAIAGAAFVGDVDEVWAWQRVPEQVEIEFLALN
jgi:hypothetical protein